MVELIHDLKDLFRQPPFSSSWKNLPLPQEFQLLFEVDIIEEQTPGAWRLVKWWPEYQGEGAKSSDTEISVVSSDTSR